MRALYPRIDILCFPSHLDAAGRPVFEAAFYGIPSVVAITNPTPDSVVDGVTGLTVAKADPALIAGALERLVRDRNFRLMLGRQARDRANEHFAIERAAASVHTIYSQLQWPPAADRGGLRPCVFSSSRSTSGLNRFASTKWSLR